jgi:diguanylate cyclase (GGDEF)-like protein/PAS domain S-box-containing protein
VSTPGMQSIRFRRPLAIVPLNEFLVASAAFVSACLAILFTREPGGIALFWPSSAIAGTLLIRLPRVRWVSAAVLVFAALFFANLWEAHRPWLDAGLFAGASSLEIALMVAVFRFLWRFPYPDISTGQAATMTAILGIAIPGVAAIPGGLILSTLHGAQFLEATVRWWSSHTIGACLLGPSIILFNVKGIKRLVHRRFLGENILILVASLFACYLTIRYVRFPFVSMGLLLLLAAFRLGGLGASLLSLCFGLLITNLWLLGIRPIGLDPAASLSSTLLGLPVIALLATVMPAIAVGLGTDARRGAVRALRVSERRFRNSMKHSPIGMLISDLDGVWTYTNLALQQMLGYSADEFRALPPGGPSKAEDWKDSESRWKHLLSGEIDHYDTVRCFRHKDGHWVWTHVAVSVLRDEDGSPIHLIAQIESLEARRHAEENLAQERERLRITLQSIDDAVVTTDASTRITYINAAANSLLGLEIKAAESRRVDEVIHLMDPQTSKTASNLIGQSALHGKVFRREEPCLLLRPDGTLCYVTEVASPVMDSTGLVSGLVIVFHDATRDVDRARDLQHRATRDPLTGLSNRADFEQRLCSVLEKSRHLDRPAAVMAIDLDRFKAVNDEGGHAAGDAALRGVAEACRIAVRSSDVLARLGGDEFAVILDNCREDRAIDIARQLLGALNPLVIEWGGSQYSIGASIGLAMNSMNLADERAWLRAADEACYIAKREGRGQLRIATFMEGDQIVIVTPR